MNNEKNTFITEDSYNNIKSTSMDIRKRLTEAGFDDNEIQALKFGEQMFESPEDLHGSSYSHFSSFLYYHENEDLSKGIQTEPRIAVDKKYTGGKVKSKKGKDWYNIDKLQNWNSIPDKTLRAGVLLIGPNAGSGSKELSFEPFENFQNGGPTIKKYCNSFTDQVDFFVDIKGENIDEKSLEDLGLKKKSNKEKDGYIRYDKIKQEEELESDIKFFKENIEGSYAMDLIKGIPTTDSGKLKTHINNAARGLYKGTKDSNGNPIYKKEFRTMTMYVNDFRKRLACIFVDVLIEEIELLGNITHTLIVMNSGKSLFTEEMLKLGNFQEKYKEKYGVNINIKRVNHYVSPTPQHIWRYQLEEAYGRKDKSIDRLEIWADKVSKDPRFKEIEFIYKKL